MSVKEIDTEETLPVLPSKNKGKGKAFPTKHDKEHLPWYFRFVRYLLVSAINILIFII